MQRVVIAQTINVLVFIFVLIYWHRDMVLIWNGQIAPAEVISVRNRRPHFRGLMRPYDVNYRFVDSQGIEHEANDTLLTGEFLINLRHVEISYSTLNPDLSRIAHQVRWLPWPVVLVNIGLFAWFSYRLVVKFRKFSWKSIG